MIGILHGVRQSSSVHVSLHVLLLIQLSVHWRQLLLCLHALLVHLFKHLVLGQHVSLLVDKILDLYV